MSQWGFVVLRRSLPLSWWFSTFSHSFLMQKPATVSYFYLKFCVLERNDSWFRVLGGVAMCWVWCGKKRRLPNRGLTKELVVGKRLSPSCPTCTVFNCGGSGAWIYYGACTSCCTGGEIERKGGKRNGWIAGWAGLCIGSRRRKGESRASPFSFTHSHLGLSAYVILLPFWEQEVGHLWSVAPGGSCSRKEETRPSLLLNRMNFIRIVDCSDILLVCFSLKGVDILRACSFEVLSISHFLSSQKEQSMISMLQSQAHFL